MHYEASCVVLTELLSYWKRKAKCVDDVTEIEKKCTSLFKVSICLRICMHVFFVRSCWSWKMATFTYSWVMEEPVETLTTYLKTGDGSEDKFAANHKVSY